MKKHIFLFLILLLSIRFDYVQSVALEFEQVETTVYKSKRKKKPTIKEPKTYQEPLGREYYDSLVHKATKRRWAFPLTTYISLETGGFNCTGCSTNLSDTIFGKDPITFKDIYLFSKLSIENKVRINNCDAKPPIRGDVLIGIAGVPFGGFSDDLYTTLLAPVQIRFDADFREYGFLPSFIYHYDLGCRELFGVAVGATLPFKSKQHVLALTFVGGELFRDGFVPDTTQRETSLRQFFRHFTSVEDFFFREVLGSKGIKFDPIQRKSGFGDVSAFLAFDYHGQPNIEFGFSIGFPTAGKGKGCNLWEPILGNGGGFQFSPFLQFIFSSQTPYLNPFFRIGAEVNSSFRSGNIRAPVLVSNPTRTQVKNVPGLKHPAFFDDFYVDPFEEFDSCVPLLSDNKICMNQKVGSRVLIGVGNYAFDLLHESFRWGIFYDFMHKSKDSFEFGLNCCEESSLEECCFSCDEIDMCTLEKCTDQNSHTLSTNLTYKFRNFFEIGLGGQFVVLGKNVPRRRTLTFNVLFVF